MNDVTALSARKSAWSLQDHHVRLSVANLEAWAEGVASAPAEPTTDVERSHRLRRAQLDSYASPIAGIGEPGSDKRLSHHIRVPDAGLDSPTTREHNPAYSRR